MTPEEFERVRDLFLTVRELDVAERSEYLDRECADNPTVRAEVETLLAQTRDSNDPVAIPSEVAGVRSDLERVLHATRPEPAPKQIGRYAILSTLGEGGMGTVYLAEQTEPVRRRVALKLIKLGMDSRQVIARFESERQALALMDHPNIARVLDAGTSEHGRPYFVMEYVPGISITEHCDRHKLPIDERLGLFIQVCHAVQHAHQKGIIHRDIKPGNILVEYINQTARPKIIDFGVAKATAQRLTERTLFTERGQLIGTPEYMSPEQAEATGQDVDTRADIYSMGVLLYELLTGALPFDPHTLRRAGFAEIQRIIREVEPLRPSTKLSSLGQVAAGATRVASGRHTPLGSGITAIDEVARNRRADLRTLRRSVRGDLDWIVMKCLEKERGRRYETAHALALDIQRHLNSEPVQASPPSVIYRLRKFARRNRGAVLAGSLITLALVAGLIGTTTFAVRESRARAREADQRRLAEQNQQKAQRVQEFLQQTLESVTPERARGKDTTLLREVLDRAAAQADEQLADQPEVLAAVRSTIGITYLGLGLFDEAEVHLTAALETRRRVLGDEHLEVAEVLNNLASVRNHRGDYAAAEPLLRESLAIKRKLLSEDDPSVTATLNNLATSLNNLGRREEAEQIHRQVLEIRRRTLGNDHPDVALTLNNLAFLLMNRGDFAGAEAMFREALDIRQRLYGDDHPDVALTLLNLGHLLGRMGRFGDAEPFLLKALELRRRLSGNEHPDTAYALNGLATNYQKQGNYAAAEPLYKEALPILERSFGEDDWRVKRVLNGLATGLYRQGKLEEAETAYRTLVTRCRASDDQATMGATLDALARVQQARGHLDAAEVTARECLTLRRENLPADEPGIANAVIGLGRVLVARDEHAQAEPLYREALAVYEKQDPPDPVAIAHSRIGLGRVLTQLGRFGEAEVVLLAAHEDCEQVPDAPASVVGGAYEALIELYDAWNAVEPDAELATKADAWRSSLARWQATTQPAPTESAAPNDD